MTEQTKTADELAQMKAAFKAQRIEFELRLEAINAGAVNPEDTVKLCDRTAIAVSEDFSTVSGAREAIAALKAAKAYLFAASTQTKIVPPPATAVPGPLKSIARKSEPWDDSIKSPQDRISRGFEKK